MEIGWGGSRDGALLHGVLLVLPFMSVYAWVLDVPSCRELFFFFFFNDTATTEIYTLSLPDALPICPLAGWSCNRSFWLIRRRDRTLTRAEQADRKSTRLNSSHRCISYAVLRLKKKNTKDRLLCAHMNPPAYGQFLCSPPQQ